MSAAMSPEQEVEDESVQVTNAKTCYWEKIPDEIREKIFEEVESLGPDETIDAGGPTLTSGGVMRCPL